MNYSIDFLERIKKAYSEHPDFHRILDNPKLHYLIGRNLELGQHFQMKPIDIVEAFTENREQDVLKEAELSIERTKLYAEWRHMVETQR